MAIRRTYGTTATALAGALAKTPTGFGQTKGGMFDDAGYSPELPDGKYGGARRSPVTKPLTLPINPAPPKRVMPMKSRGRGISTPGANRARSFRGLGR